MKDLSYMDSQFKSRFISEFIWLIGIVIISGAVEYLIIAFFDLHPVLSVKVQGFIGLVVIAYVIRMITRMGDEGLITFEDEDE
ncbi:hypothetical protein [Fodinibius saliphilus]|uniref:hypothetical protein n=1 Tax=Fodinibius saliphilus TaxID=1920650 RepID=UPI0011082314|nr:hypothetical protein [Fodinibius saliphilus]